MKRTLYFLIPVFLLLSSYSPKPKKMKWLEGSWVGTGYEPSNQSHWLTNLDYDLASGAVSVIYPSFPCSGHWELVKANKNQAIFIEYITENTELCQDQGTMIVTKINHEFISIAYFLPEYDDDIIGSSILRKTLD